uniref:Transposase Tc1-like domain-containing protein n=1 Tax=Seriola dumerili TaxID=41447 RepID=A0A3B4V995_SERDU
MFNRRIAKDLRCSPSAVKYTSDRHNATNSHQNRKGRGRKNKLSDSEVRHLKLLCLKDRRKTSQELRDEINTQTTNGATVSSRTVCRKLGEERLVGRIAAKKPLLKEKNRVKRLKFEKEHKKWTKEDWYKVLRTDESKFEQFGNKRRVYVRRRDGERYKNECLLSTVKHGGGSIMVWGAISASGTVVLLGLDLFSKRTMTLNILLTIARTTCDRRKSAGTLKMMDWPPQSPHLNPIEKIWSELENTLDRSIVHSKESLWQKAWDNISVEVLRKYIDTMPERCTAVIAAKGGHTRY